MSEQVAGQAGAGRIFSRIAGTGSYLPEKVLTNADLEKLVETSDEFFTSDANRPGRTRAELTSPGARTSRPR